MVSGETLSITSILLTFMTRLYHKYGDFSFPWPNSGRETQKTKDNVKEAIWNGNLPEQKHPVSWLIERFAPVSGWDEKALAKLNEKEGGRRT